MTPSETSPRSALRLVLLVEDADDQRTLTARQMYALGWNCLAHASAESALGDPRLPSVEAVVADIVLGEGMLEKVTSALTCLYGKLGVSGRAESSISCYPASRCRRRRLCGYL